jgi:hypothetical protein
MLECMQSRSANSLYEVCLVRMRKTSRREEENSGTHWNSDCLLKKGHQTIQICCQSKERTFDDISLREQFGRIW